MQDKVQIPRSAGELLALRQRRDELDSQLRGLTDRRQQLVAERANASAFSGNQAMVGELDLQIKDLGTRLRRIEANKLAMDDAISQALANGVTDQGGQLMTMPGIPSPGEPVIAVPPPGVDSRLVGNLERLVILEGVGFLILGFFLWRLGIRRGRREAVGSGHGDPQLRQAVDAIAIEVERISENQRYVTKLLNEQKDKVV